MQARKIAKDWHEPELSRHLGPVRAPDELWDRVHGAEVSSSHRVYTSRPRTRAWQWAAAAAATVAVVAGITVWQNRTLSGEEQAVRALSRAPEQLQFRSADLAELRAWVKTDTGLDVPLPVHTSSSVQMVGAYVSRKGSTPTAEISYRVGGVDAALVVSRIPMEGEGRHAFVKSGSYHGSSFQSWTMRGQMYTLASADARVGCLLCHITGAPRTSVN
jgi:hypothetical protein